MKNIFMENQKEITFEEYMAYKKDGRENLGDNLPVAEIGRASCRERV